jgi:5-methyltetrahydropteroyltriglutamate--homocysteine methyltransferase
METDMHLAPLATTSIGSFPRPRWLAKTNVTRAAFVVPPENIQEACDDATILVLRHQEKLGLDLVTDGEQRREGFIFHIAGQWTGIDMENFALKERYRNRVANQMVPRIVGKITRRSPAAVEDTRFAKTHTDRPLKMQVPGPMTVIDSTLNEFYDDESELALDIAIALNQELLEIQAAGCDVIQIDEPAMTRYHDKLRDYGAKALDRCLEGITVPTLVHLCCGYPGLGRRPQHEYKYSGVLPELMKTRICGFTVEFGRSQFDPEVLKACGDRIVMVGCIDPGSSPAPSVDSVKRRVAGVLEYLSPGQVWLAPDCGLMTISRELATQKLQVMVEAAHSLRRQV